MRENTSSARGMVVATDINDALLLVNWDFPDAPPSSGIHAVHPYPARFIPQIPQKLIEILHPGDSSAVLDPFCGCGTTLVEAINMGFDAIGIDVNPLACLIARVKTDALPEGLAAAAARAVRSARKQLDQGLVRIPLIPRLDHWFRSDIQKALAALVEQIDRESPEAFRNALKVALSSIIVRVSNQDSDTRYAAVEKRFGQEDVFAFFQKAATSLGEAVGGLSDNLFRRLGNATVINRDTLSISSSDLPRNVGLVVTSPPYPNAYEYWLYHKYRMYWLGMNPVEVKNREIGARPHYFKAKPQDERDFARQMGLTFQLLGKLMNPNARACFVVGRSILRGRLIDNGSLLRTAAESCGFAVEADIERQIPSTRKTFNPKHCRIDRENILVFRLESKT